MEGEQMSGSIFNEEDLIDIRSRGIAPEKVLEQVEKFRKGFPFAKLIRPCIIGDGIRLLEDSDIERLHGSFEKAESSGRIIKFVPASGAASRMFKLLSSFNHRLEKTGNEEIVAEANKGDKDCSSFLRFMKEIEKLPFYEELASSMSKDGIDIHKALSEGNYKAILTHTLGPAGLNLADLPKGLIPFHRYEDYTRTPFEEHIVEAGSYAKSGDGVSKIHFTVSPEHEESIVRHIENIRGRYEKPGLVYEFHFSSQKPSTDTIAVDMENNPFREQYGKLLFRPGGHGALLENLNELEGDIIFIKNIDNVVPDRLKETTFIYKKALGGFLIELQDRIFRYLKTLEANRAEDALLNEIFDFIKYELSVTPPPGIETGARDKKIDYLVSRLNRPLRVCGMVRNVAEPGGGPFWMEHGDKTASIQIVETSQMDLDSKEQKSIFDSSTHFNPVDLVCGVRDYLGRPFDLKDYVDHDTGLIAVKSKDGKELKALELPGLWNGSMAHWNSVFVEVPLITFNPVKTVLDLLRKEHQQE
jgi:hypothetical protein